MVAAPSVVRVRTERRAVPMGCASVCPPVRIKSAARMDAVVSVVPVWPTRPAQRTVNVCARIRVALRSVARMPAAMCAVFARMAPPAMAPVFASAHPIAPTRIAATMDAGASAECAERGRCAPSMVNVP